MLEHVDEKLAALSHQMSTARDTEALVQYSKQFAMLQQLIRLDQFIEMLRANDGSSCGRHYNRALDDVLRVIRSEAGL